MDVFETLETRVGRLIEAYKTLQGRVAELEAANRALKVGDETVGELREQISHLEAERDEVRTRLEKVLETLAALEI